MAQAYNRAGSLLRSLSRVAGNPAAIDAYMRRWVDANGVSAAGMIALAAVRTTFADCLTRVDEVPPGSLAYTPIKEDDTDDR